MYSTLSSQSSGSSETHRRILQHAAFAPVDLTGRAPRHAAGAGEEGYHRIMMANPHAAVDLTRGAYDADPAAREAYFRILQQNRNKKVEPYNYNPKTSALSKKGKGRKFKPSKK